MFLPPRQKGKGVALRMLTLPCKDGEAPISPDWLREWHSLYLNVDEEILKARSWALDNPSKRKTRRGARAFLGNWIRRACPLKPVVRSTPINREPVTTEPLETRRARLAELRRALA